MVHTPTEPVRTQPRIRWYRHPWVALALAVLAVILLVTALGLRLVADAEVAAAMRLIIYHMEESSEAITERPAWFSSRMRS